MGWTGVIKDDSRRREERIGEGRSGRWRWSKVIKEHSRTGEDRRQGEDRLKTRRGRWRWTGASRDKKRMVRQDRQQRGGCKKQCRGQGVLECDKQCKGKGVGV